MSEQTELVKSILKTVLKQGTTGAKKVGKESRKQVALRGLKQRKATLYQKLGKEVEQLIVQGELEHPTLARALKHLADVDAEIEAINAKSETSTESE